jgi:hypothetical protein
MKYAVMFEPFDGLEYVCKPKKDYQLSGDEPLLFNRKWMAQMEADKWNSGIVVEYKENNHGKEERL